MKEVESAMACLTAQYDLLVSQGLSEAWVGDKEGKTYSFWLEGKRLRSRRVNSGEAEVIRKSHDRWLAARWLKTTIEDMESRIPKRLSRGVSA